MTYNWTVHCTCGNTYSLLTHTVCPRCFAWPKRNEEDSKK